MSRLLKVTSDIQVYLIYLLGHFDVLWRPEKKRRRSKRRKKMVAEVTEVNNNDDDHDKSTCHFSLPR